MGGNVFHTTATRLTTPQLLLLLAHTKKVLAPYFSALEITRFLSDKETHGDLDVVCGLWTGGEGWKGANEAGTVPSNPPNMDQGKYENISEDHDWTRREVREFCGLIAEKLGARKWEKNGMEASFAVPCSVIDKDTTLTGVNHFYQIDLLLHHPPNVGFAVLTQSYGVTALLFAAAVRRLSSSFTCHNDRFVIKYSPYQGLKAIEVELTHDPKEFMEWAGLDVVRFDQGFANESDYFMWLTCQSGAIEGTEEEQKAKYENLLEKKFPQGWKKMAGRKKEADPTKMPRGHGKIRLKVMARFREWLLTTAYKVEAPVSPKPETTIDSTKTDSAQGITADISTLSLSSAETTAKPAKPIISAREQNLLDPEKYQVLSSIDIAALEHFGKKAQWELAFEGRKGEATVMAERQKRNSKENAASHKVKQEAQQAKNICVREKVPDAVVQNRRSDAKAVDMDEGVSL